MHACKLNDGQRLSSEWVAPLNVKRVLLSVIKFNNPGEEENREREEEEEFHICLSNEFGLLTFHFGDAGRCGVVGFFWAPSMATR